VVYHGDRSIFVDLEEGRTVVLGRSDEADVIVETSTVSRRHLALRWAGGVLTARDCGSTNGTLVNGVKLAGEAVLGGGEEIAMGEALVIVGLSSPRSATRRLLEPGLFDARLAQETLRASRLGRSLVLVRLVAFGSEEEVHECLDAVRASLPGHAVLGALSPAISQAVVADATLEPVASAISTLLADRGWGPGRLRAGLAEFPRHGQSPSALVEHVARALERPDAADAGGAVSSPGTDPPPTAADPVSVRLFSLVSRVAATDATVLLVGETGVGKDVVARALHARSRRSGGPFVRVDCGAIPTGIFAREMFGNEPGAFTGARDRRIGLFEAASGGTLFLDEVAEIPLMDQPRLLRALEQRAVTRVGGVKETPVDIRIVAATNRDLEELVAQGLFREDLFFRLNVIAIFVPALRDRPGDIAPLVRGFVERIVRSSGRGEVALSPEAVEVLARHGWPGNVRELRNVVERAVLLAAGPTVEPEDVLRILHAEAVPSLDLAGDVALKTLVEEVERLALVRTLERCGQNQSLAAERLGISRRALIYKMQRYQIAGRGRSRAST
jgi:DNA-binding NtrC family response regulator